MLINGRLVDDEQRLAATARRIVSRGLKDIVTMSRKADPKEKKCIYIKTDEVWIKIKESFSIDHSITSFIPDI